MGPEGQAEKQQSFSFLSFLVVNRKDISLTDSPFQPEKR
jgi:hypothetical protein